MGKRGNVQIGSVYTRDHKGSWVRHSTLFFAVYGGRVVQR